MKNLILSALIASVLPLSANASDIGEVYSKFTMVSVRGTLILPISPTLTTIDMANDRKVLMQAYDDAAYYLASGESTAVLHQALETLRRYPVSEGLTDEELALLIVESL